MISGGLSLQRRIYQILTADGAYRVYDDAPSGASFPYITIGESTMRQEGHKLAHGEDVTITFHIWSRSRGFREAYTIIDWLTSHLRAGVDLSADGFHALPIETPINATVLRDPDGLTRHGVAAYRYKIYKTGGM